MQDVYTYGRVNRISPEAPVPVFQVVSESSMPGGAGNVALNLAGLGCEVKFVARVGQDEAGHQLVQLLGQMSHDLVDSTHIVFEQGYQTPVKNRLIASSQQLLRQDREKPYQELNPLTRQALLKIALQLLDEVDIVAVSDYGKGGIDRVLLEPVFEKAKALGIAIVVDPKSRDFSLYRGATLIKPNLKEAMEIKGAPIGTLDEIASHVLKELPDLQYLLVTRSQEGISIFQQTHSRMDFPARSFEVVDVTGAGDCVLAALVLSLACGLPIEIGAQLANIAGSIAIQHLGCVQLSFKELSRHLLKLDAHNKIFDERHLFALQQVCENENIHLICASLEDIQSIQFILLLQEHRKQYPDILLLIEVQTENVHSPWIDFLARQPEADFVIFASCSLQKAGKIDAHEIWQWNKQVNSLTPIKKLPVRS